MEAASFQSVTWEITGACLRSATRMAMWRNCLSEHYAQLNLRVGNAMMKRKPFVAV